MAKMEKPSGASARPIDAQTAHLLSEAGIVQRENTAAGSTQAQSRAAKESREQMVSCPGKNNTPLHCPGKDVTQKVMSKMTPRPSKSDPNGSWTGVPINPWETPVQDADDL